MPTAGIAGQEHGESASLRERSVIVPSTRARAVGLYALLALLVSIPCFWQQHIQSEDLSSHLYNAWMVNEVSEGRLPGLYVTPQYTNVLFDHLLSFLLKTGGLYVAEHVSVLLGTQIFFWGCFTFISSVTGRRAWDVAPILMILAFGAVLRLGLFNFYIAIGLGLWAIGLIWRNHLRTRWLAIPVLALSYTAHAIPFAWALGVSAYLIVVRRLELRRRLWLLAVGVISIAGFALILRFKIPSGWPPAFPLLTAFGIDQLLTFGAKYKVLAAALLCLWILLLVRGFETRQVQVGSIALQLWVLSVATCLFLPDAIWLPFYSGALTWISLRLSLLAAILLCATVAPMRWNLVEKSISWALLTVFLAFTYADEHAIAVVEQKMARAAASFPAGTRFVSTLADSHLYVKVMGLPRGVSALEHLMDRVCIGRCFSFGSYEAATTQFRLRARPGNPYVIADVDDASFLEHGEYVWRRRDIELYKLYPCDTGPDVCAARVREGEILAKHDFPSVPNWWGHP